LHNLALIGDLAFCGERSRIAAARDSDAKATASRFVAHSGSDAVAAGAVSDARPGAGSAATGGTAAG
jgi:hypothetical protein